MLVADACNQQPFEPGEWGLRVVLSRHFCGSLHVGHARRIRPIFNYRITDLEAHIKTNKTNNIVRQLYFKSIVSKSRGANERWMMQMMS